MAVDVKVDVNSIEVTNLLKNIGRKQKAVIEKSLKRVSNMAVLMITKRTQAGKLPDGGQMRHTLKAQSEAVKRGVDKQDL